MDLIFSKFFSRDPFHAHCRRELSERLRLRGLLLATLNHRETIQPQFMGPMNVDSRFRANSETEQAELFGSRVIIAHRITGNVVKHPVVLDGNVEQNGFSRSRNLVRLCSRLPARASEDGIPPAKKKNEMKDVKPKETVSGA